MNQPNPEGKVALVPGSFDPVTVGHIALIERASRLFDRVIVAVMDNREKEYCFSREDRRHFCEVALKEYPNVSVMADSGMLIDLYRRIGASCVVKGIRNEADLRYENLQAEWNHAHLETFETVYLPADPHFNDISSSRVRDALSEGNSDLLREFLPPEVLKELLPGTGIV